MFYHLTAFAFIFLLYSPGVPASAKPYSATRLIQAAASAFQQNNTQESEALLRKAILIDPGSGLAWFNLGLIQRHTGQDKAAVQSFKKVSELGSPLGPAAELQTAELFLESERPFEAWRALRRVQISSLPPGLSNSAQNLRSNLAELALKQGLSEYNNGEFRKAKRLLLLSDHLTPSSESSLLLALIARRMRDSRSLRLHLNRAARHGDSSQDIVALQQMIDEVDGKAVQILIDTGLKHDTNVFRDGVQSTPLARSGAFIYGGVLFDLVRRKDWRLESQWFTGVEEYFELEEQRYIELGGHLLLSGRWHKSLWALRPQATVSHFGGRPFLARTGLGGTWMYPWGNRALGLDLLGEAVTPTSEFYSHLQGHFASLSLFFRWGLKPVWTAYSFAELNESGDFASGTNTLPLSYRGLGAGLKSLIRMGQNWTITIDGNAFFADFKNRFMPQNKPRRDQQFRFSSQIHYYFGPEMSIYVGGEHNVSRSTMDESSAFDRNIDFQMFTIGVQLKR